MPNTLRIAMAQQMFAVGDVNGNKEKIIHTLKHAHEKLQADVCVFPELALCGYPAEDLLWLPDFKQQIQQALHEILEASMHYPDLYILLGFPHYLEEKIFNALIVIKKGEVVTIVHKQCLPNKGVFEELRQFSAGVEGKIIKIKNIKVGLLVCEDIWHKKPGEKLHQQGVDLMIVINASPYAIDKHRRRLSVVTEFSTETGIPALYLNGVNAQDDLIFDGGSFYVNGKGKLVWQGDFYQENIYLIELAQNNGKVEIQAAPPTITVPSDEELIYKALVLGLREYVNKNHIKGVILGLSGGIDSALVLAIAVDALGADKVLAVSLPSRYTAKVSIQYAEKQALTLGVPLKIIDIDELYNKFLTTLTPHFNNLPADTTEENLQSRCRGTVLMGLANKYHYIVVNTSNKSELAMGYGTLYGDMLGAYAVLKDVLKTDVYRLANYKNSLSAVIPQEVIDRPPTAELAHNQTDQDSLPPYNILDEIIRRYVEQQQSLQTIIDAGFASELVHSIVRRINQNEYKRRQGPPGPKVSMRAFSRERHYPITTNFLTQIQDKN
jgi:NAD+ synthase (glutamine-hydrolysing)